MIHFLRKKRRAASCAKYATISAVNSYSYFWFLPQILLPLTYASLRFVSIPLRSEASTKHAAGGRVGGGRGEGRGLFSLT